MPITAGTIRLGKQLRNKVGRQADDATRAIAAAWVASWHVLLPDMTAAVNDVVQLAVRLGRWPSAYELRRFLAVQQAIAQAQAALARLGDDADTTITAAAAAAVQTTGQHEPIIIASQLPAAGRAAAAARFAAAISATALAVITAQSSARITGSTKTIAGQAADAMSRELARVSAPAASAAQTSQQLLAGLQDGFNSGLGRAVTVARTEVLDAYRAASAYAQQSNADVLQGWMWLCDEGPTTCGSCIAMDGTEFPLSEPGPDDHVNGRCTRMPILRSWDDLGLDDVEPDHNVPSSRAWFDRQPATVQIQILGRGRLELLRAGAITWDDIPLLRTNSNWRPSYSPRSLADLQKIAAARR